MVVFFVTGTDNSVLGGVYFSQISVIYFTWDLAAVCIIGVSASRELTVHGPISGRMNKQGGWHAYKQQFTISLTEKD